MWCGLEQRAVDDATDQWRRRLLACVDAEDGHFKHNLGQKKLLVKILRRYCNVVMYTFQCLRNTKVVF